MVIAPWTAASIAWTASRLGRVALGRIVSLRAERRVLAAPGLRARYRTGSTGDREGFESEKTLLTVPPISAGHKKCRGRGALPVPEEPHPYGNRNPWIEPFAELKRRRRRLGRTRPGRSRPMMMRRLDRLSADEQRAVLEAEGLSPGDADAFLRQATERALGDFLENPQNLLMLLRAVQTGTWPATRKELFELSTQIMLKEFDKERARSGSGVYSVDELRPAGGAVCAARLISDIAAVSLADNEESKEIPSYRSLGMLPPEKVIAALGRRVFVAGPVPESVDYANRTTAEYLGAAWLADAVRNGMSFGRLQALMGVDGHPAPELRGIHAWLAVHLPEYADRLIDTDPYGVLTYGDAASLARSSCANLVRALGRLSLADPWFRSGNWQSPAIGALSRPDMVDEFRAVLRSKDSGFGVRSIVVEAAALGAPLPALKNDLVDVLQRSQSPYAERSYALVALLRIEPGGEAAAEAASPSPAPPARPAWHRRHPGTAVAVAVLVVARRSA
jgi:hypothetical protein